MERLKKKKRKKRKRPSGATRAGAGHYRAGGAGAGGCSGAAFPPPTPVSSRPSAARFPTAGCASPPSAPWPRTLHACWPVGRNRTAGGWGGVGTRFRAPRGPRALRGPPTPPLSPEVPHRADDVGGMLEVLPPLTSPEHPLGWLSALHPFLLQEGQGVEQQRVGVEWGRDGVGWGRERGWDGEWGGIGQGSGAGQGRGWDVDAAGNGAGWGRDRDWGGMCHGMGTA